MAKTFTREQLLCSICLEVFIDPVSTSCGHNFCKSCITQFWETSHHCYCPLCNETFTNKPELNINRTLRDVADHLKKSGFDKPEILCDACTEAKLKALKSCLDCGLSLCLYHLESHNSLPNLKNHKQIDPEENLQDYICQKHKRPLQLFCKDDQTCVCLFCPITDCKNHNTVPIEEVLSQLQKTINTHKEIKKLEQKSQQKGGESSWPFLLLLLLLIVILIKQNEMMFQSYAVDITLDPETAHPTLILSQDRKQVAYGDKWQKLPYTPKRFDTCACILGKQSFNSGRFYFEVQVSARTNWVLGVTREDISRKDQIVLAPKDGYWTLGLRDWDGHMAFADSPVVLTLRKKPEKVGVFVDYEESLVAFYNADTRFLIYSFSGQSFTKKLYPFFCPGVNKNGNSAPLIILG